MSDATPPNSFTTHRGVKVELCSAWGCNAVWSKDISGLIPLCRYHFATAHAAWANYMDATDEQMAARMASAPVEKKHMQTVTVAHDSEGGPVVYYVSMPPYIKIGTTRSFRRRMREFYTQPEDVLAVEPGGRALEASRHQQFAAFRIKGTELFSQNGVLDDLISSIASTQLDPWIAADEIHNPPALTEQVNRELYESRLKLGLIPENARLVQHWTLS